VTNADARQVVDAAGARRDMVKLLRANSHEHQLWQVWCAAHMAYVQLSLLGIPGIVVVGDTLRMESRAVWYTPAHIVGGWSRRLRGGVDILADLPALLAAEPKNDVPAAGQLALPLDVAGRAA
jgi:hypothetical protein